MTTALTIAQPRNIDETMQLGKLLAASGFFADSRDAAQAVVKVLAGAELGFGPIASMTGVNIIKGKVTLSANLIAAAIKRSGRYNYRVVKMTDAVCEIDFYEGREKIGTSAFSMDDAKSAGLASNDNWRKFPRNMLFARAISNGAKWFCPDLSGGPLYTPDELGAAVDGETGEVIDAGQYAPAPTRSITVEQPSQPSGPPPIWLDWTRPDHAQEWAMTQGKFNHPAHMMNAYAKVKAALPAGAKAADMWQAWVEYVNAHAPAKPVEPQPVEPQPDDDPDGWGDIDANGVQPGERPPF